MAFSWIDFTVPTGEIIFYSSVHSKIINITFNSSHHTRENIAQTPLSYNDSTGYNIDNWRWKARENLEKKQDS